MYKVLVKTNTNGYTDTRNAILRNASSSEYVDIFLGTPSPVPTSCASLSTACSAPVGPILMTNILTGAPLTALTIRVNILLFALSFDFTVCSLACNAVAMSMVFSCADSEISLLGKLGRRRLSSE
jgi:hypothetical protein